MWDGVILAFSESPHCKKPSINFLIKSIYGLEEDVGWRIPRCLFSAWPSLMSEWDDFSYLWVSILPKAFHPFLIKRIYGLEEDVCWRIPRWLFSAWPFLMCEWDDFCYFWVAIMSEAFLKFLLKRIYDFKEDVGWRIPRWLFSAWPSLMCKWVDFCYFWVSILPEAFHQFSAQENIWFGRCKVKKLQDGCLEHGSLWCVNGVSLAISESPWCLKPSIKFLLKRIYGLEDVEEIQDDCLVQDHLL